MNVSVVIPLYNKEKYIGRAISSILDQTIQPDEIVIVDDGSTDNSANEVLKFKDDRIRLVQQQNSGVGAARNKGVEEAKYDLVAFLDADDQWKPDFLSHIKMLYNKYPDCGAYATAYEVVFPGNHIVRLYFEGIPAAPWMGIIPDFFKVIQCGAPFYPSSVAISKKVFHELKGFPEKIPQGEDRILWVRLGMKYSIAFSSSSQVNYYSDIPNSAIRARYDAYPVIARVIEEMLKNQEVPNSLINDIKDYITYIKIQRVYHLVINGRAKEARELLRLTGSNQKYHRQLLLWQFLSFVPYSFIKVFRAIRSKNWKA